MSYYGGNKMSIACKACSKENPEGSKYCLYCGESLQNISVQVGINGSSYNNTPWYKIRNYQLVVIVALVCGLAILLQAFVGTGDTRKKEWNNYSLQLSSNIKKLMNYATELDQPFKRLMSEPSYNRNLFDRDYLRLKNGLQDAKEEWQKTVVPNSFNMEEKKDLETMKRLVTDLYSLQLEAVQSHIEFYRANKNPPTTDNDVRAFDQHIKQLQMQSRQKSDDLAKLLEKYNSLYGK
jgi:hypothetical protein